MAKFKASVVQMRSGVNLDANIKAMEAGIREAASAGATYIQTPEMTGLVQADRKAFFAVVPDQSSDPVAAAASSLAQELGGTVHLGATPVRIGENKAAVMGCAFDLMAGKEINSVRRAVRARMR